MDTVCHWKDQIVVLFLKRRRNVDVNSSRPLKIEQVQEEEQQKIRKRRLLCCILNCERMKSRIQDETKSNSQGKERPA